MRLELWCLMPLSISFIGGGNQSTTDRSQVTDKLYHTMLNWVHLAMSAIRTHIYDCEDWSLKKKFKHPIDKPGRESWSRLSGIKIIQQITIIVFFLCIMYPEYIVKKCTIYSLGSINVTDGRFMFHNLIGGNFLLILPLHYLMCLTKIPEFKKMSLKL